MDREFDCSLEPFFLASFEVLLATDTYGRVPQQGTGGVDGGHLDDDDGEGFSFVF